MSRIEQSQFHDLVRLDAAIAGGRAPKGATRLERIRRTLVVAVLVVPLLAAIAYNFLVATPRYQSEFSFVVRSLDSPRDRFSLLSVAQPNVVADNSEVIIDYIHSRDALAAINRDGLVSRVFARAGLDTFSAFPSLVNGRGGDEFHRHFQRYLHADFDRASNITHVAVQSFTAADARQIGQRLMIAAEAKVNALNGRIRQNLVTNAAQDVADAGKNVTTALARLSAVRNANAVIEPKLQGGAAIGLASRTAGELAGANVQLSQLQRAAPNSPLLGQARVRRAALGAQLRAQERATAGPPGSLAARLREYELADAERDIAEKRMATASLRLVRARENAGRLQLYVERIATPNLADEALFPRAWRNVLITLLVCGALAWIAMSLAEIVFGDD